MKSFFICPDGEFVRIQSCLRGCRMEKRCLALPTLAALSETRKWNGVSPSVAGKGDRAIYLEIVTPYAVDPKSQMFALYGTKHHAIKEDASDIIGDTVDVERYLPSVNGISDCYDKKDKILIDFKFVGSGRLGQVACYSLEPTGEKYKTTSKYGKKGDPKMKKVLTGFDIPQDHDFAMQVNRYRQGLENEGDEVKEMFIEATVRDGGTQSALGRGMTELVYTIPVPFVTDRVLDEYYDGKEKRVQEALDTKTAPPLCSKEERWDGTRCKYYCPVFRECAKAGGWNFRDLREVVRRRK